MTTDISDQHSSGIVDLFLGRCVRRDDPFLCLPPWLPGRMTADIATAESRRRPVQGGTALTGAKIGQSANLVAKMLTTELTPFVSTVALWRRSGTARS